MPNVKKMRPGRKRWSKEKFDRCLSKVKGRNPYAVCMASMQGTTKRKKRKRKKRR